MADKPKCKLCGGPIKRRSIYGICNRNPQCIAEYCRVRSVIVFREMTDAQRKRRLWLIRKWSAKNIDKVRAYGRARYAKHIEAIRIKNKKYWAEHGSEVNERRRAKAKAEHEERQPCY